MVTPPAIRGGYRAFGLPKQKQHYFEFRISNFELSRKEVIVLNFLEYLKKNKAKDEKEPNADKIFMRSVAISFVAIIFCAVLLSASTYAWFVKSIESNETIKSSIYTLDISAAPEEKLTAGQSTEGNVTYQLLANETYILTVTAVDDGTTNGSTGYIKLKVGDQIFISEQIDRGDTLEFKLTFTAATEIEIIECWGTSSASERHISPDDSFTDMVEQP